MLLDVALEQPFEALHIALGSLPFLLEFGGDEAVAAVQAERPAVILLDVTMPRTGGMEALPELKRIAPDVPVIMCTAHMDVPTAVRAMQLGAENFLPKPVDMEHLAAAPARALGPSYDLEIVARPHPNDGQQRRVVGPDVERDR